MKKVLYINDYGCSLETIDDCKNGLYPQSHLWGMLKYIHSHPKDEVKLFNINSITLPSFFCKFKRIIHLYRVFCIFILNIKYDVVYSALPGYELGFLITKSLKLKKYKIISVVHHPVSRLMLKNQYDKLIFISKIAYEKYAGRKNTEYIFWGPDNDFYKIESAINKTDVNYDFISAGKTHRDYKLMNTVLSQKKAKYKIIGDNNMKENEVSYTELLSYYCKSRFVCIPMKQIYPPNSILIGLTSFIDAISLGLPVLMSDNSLIGVDVEKLKIGKIYKAESREDFAKQVDYMLTMSDEEYQNMHRNCIEFANNNSFEIFSNRICHLIDE